MGNFKEEITLVNMYDMGKAGEGLISETEIRKITARAMPDTGAWTLVINEDSRNKLGIIETSQSSLADGKTDTCGVTEGVRICWKNRGTVLPAVVVPEAKETLLGALPLEAMDLMVDPVNKQLAGGPRRPAPAYTVLNSFNFTLYNKELESEIVKQFKLFHYKALCPAGRCCNRGMHGGTASACFCFL